MKKFGIYLLPMLALGMMASCEEDPFKGIPQENPQEEQMTVENFSVNLAPAISGESLDLNSYIDQTIPVVSVGTVENLPEGAQVSFQMELASDEAFSNARVLDVVGGAVSANEWSDAFRAMLGRSPKAKTNYVRFAAYVTQGSNVFRLGNENTFWGARTLTVTPIDLGVKIESAYYLIGNCNGWNTADLDAWQFHHSDADVYDDPNFSIEVEIDEDAVNNGGWWWKIVPQSVKEAEEFNWGALFGVAVNGDSSLSGYITDTPAEGSSEVGAGCILEPGKYKLTINMEDGTYEFAPSGSLYVIGDGCGWNHGNAQQLFKWGDGFVGFAYVGNEFKFTDAPDWNHGDFGMGAEPGTLGIGGGNIPSDGPGLYYFSVNIDAMTYELTPITSISMIGDFNGWGGDVELTPSENFLIWTGTLELTEPGGWKFRMNNDWGINLGGTNGDLVPNGDNLWNPAGTYSVTLDLRTLPLHCTVE